MELREGDVVEIPPNLKGGRTPSLGSSLLVGPVACGGRTVPQEGPSRQPNWHEHLGLRSHKRFRLCFRRGHVALLSSGQRDSLDGPGILSRIPGLRHQPQEMPELSLGSLFKKGPAVLKDEHDPRGAWAASLPWHEQSGLAAN